MNSAPRLLLDGNSLQLSGDINPDNVLAIRKEGERLIAARSEAMDRQAMVIGLSGLGATQSVVLSLLLCWFREARTRHLTLRFEGAGDRLQSLAALSGLDDHLPGFGPEPGSELERESISSPWLTRSL